VDYRHGHGIYMGVQHTKIDVQSCRHRGEIPVVVHGKRISRLPAMQ